MSGLIYAALIQCGLLAFQGISYMLIQRFQGKYHDMLRPVDRLIPLVSQAVYIYVLWYPMLFLYPLYLYSVSRESWMMYLLAIVLDILISLGIYVLYPTSFQRPEPPALSLSGKILRLLYVLNYRGLNCTPSMHCSQCFIILFSVAAGWTGGFLSPWIGAGVIVLALSIIVSTVLTKQHVVIDVVTAFPLGIVCFTAAYQLAGFF